MPFSQSVAAHFPPPRVQEAAPAHSNTSFASLPDYLRERIAQAADVPVADVKPEHLAQITRLSLSDTPITQAELRHLATAQSLETLYLSGCPALRSTEGLQHLPALKWLSLMGCTGLEDAEVLQGLSGLDRLEELSLTSCRGLRSTQGLPPLPALKTLYLTNCTGLEGAEALQGLSGLDRLEVLDLDGCTGLDKQALAALRKQLPAACIIFGPDGNLVEK